MSKSLPDQLVEYLVFKEQCKDRLPKGLEVCRHDFQLADRIIQEAISQAVGVLCSVTSTADRVNNLTEDAVKEALKNHQQEQEKESEQA